MAFNLTLKSKTAEASVSLTTDFLMRYLSLARNVVAKRTTIPILRYVRLYSKNGKGYLRVTDCNCYVEMAFTSSGNGDIDVALEYTAFLALVTKVPKGNMLIEREGMKLQFRMNCTDFGYILGVPGTDCPALLVPPHTTEIYLTDFDVKFIDKYVSPLCVSSGNYPALQGILMEVSSDYKYGFVSSDSQMLIYTNIVDPIEKHIMPPLAFKLAAKYGKESKIYVGPKHYRIVSGGLSVYGCYIYEDFPTYRRLIYTDYDHVHKVNVGIFREELNRLLNSIERTKSGACPVWLTYDSEYLGVKTVPDDYVVNKGGIKMDGVKLIGLMKRFDDNSHVVFKSSSTITRPTVWVDGNATTLCMCML